MYRLNRIGSVHIIFLLNYRIANSVLIISHMYKSLYFVLLSIETGVKHAVSTFNSSQTDSGLDKDSIYFYADAKIVLQSTPEFCYSGLVPGETCIVALLLFLWL